MSCCRGGDIWTRHCYKKHTEKRLLCAIQPRLGLKKEKKSTSLLWQAGPSRCEGPMWLRAAVPPACKGPLQPYGDPNNYTASPIRGGPGVPTKFKTTQLVEPPSSSPAHQHPIPQKMGLFNRSRAGPGVFAAPLIETYVQHIETQGLPFSVGETSDCFSEELGGNPSQNA